MSAIYNLLNRPRSYSLPAALLTILLFNGCDKMPVDVPKITNPLEEIFALNCPGVTAHAANVDTFLVIGHRGSPTKEVENTIPSFQRAMDDGANALEIDLCMTSDGHIVLWHDWNPDDAIALLREQGGESSMRSRPRFPKVGHSMRRPVDELTLAEFREHFWYASKNLIDKERLDAEIPTFDQFVEWAAKQPKLYYVMYDMKIPGSKAHLAEAMVRKIKEAVELHKPTFTPVYLTPQQSVWEVFSRSLEGIGLAFDVDLGAGLVDKESCDASSSRLARQYGGSRFATTMHPFVWTESPWTTLKRLLQCDLEARDAALAAGEIPLVEKVVAATINDAEKMECLVDLGIDGLMTDDPALLRSIAAGKGRNL